jgi:hypothetical protein
VKIPVETTQHLPELMICIELSELYGRIYFISIKFCTLHVSSPKLINFPVWMHFGLGDLHYKLLKKF